MAEWNTNSDLISREEAEAKILKMAKDKGIKGSFKTFYDGTIVASPADLPDEVDMTKVKVSATLDQA